MWKLLTGQYFLNIDQLGIIYKEYYLDSTASRRAIFRPYGANMINIALNPNQNSHTISYWQRGV